MILSLAMGQQFAWLTPFNTFVWIVANLLVLLIFISAAFFSIAYPILFKIDTTGGWRIWRAILSIAGFGLLSILGTFVDPQSVQWWQLPPTEDWWHPIVRLLVFGVIAHSFASLATYLMHRRFAPERLNIAPAVYQLMESDLRLNYGSGTGLPDASVVAKRMIDAGWTKPGLIDPLPNTLGVAPRDLPIGRNRRNRNR